jgi:septum formation protein
LFARTVLVVDSGLVEAPRERIVLASGSPRRRELLHMIGLSFEVAVPSIDETLRPDADPSSFVMNLAMKKALSVAENFPSALLIGADTVVVLDGRVLGKPEDPGDAERMLRALSGRTHTVYTGVALLDAGSGLKSTAFEMSLVTMKELTDTEIRSYVRTGEPMDKAGSYGIQGVGGIFITNIKGCFFNVMGLPVGRLYDMLKEFGGRLEDERGDR